MKIENPNQVVLCKAGSCCVRIEKIEENQYNFYDDYNGKVQLTKEEFLMLKEAVHHFLPDAS